MKFDSQKDTEIIKYIIAHGVNNAYHIMKAVYFADKYHLEHYGRQVNGNKFIAMDMGPVPSEMYDHIKAIRGGYVPGFHSYNRHFIAADDLPNEDYLSESDKEALDYGISQVKGLSVGQVMDKSHDTAYNMTDIDKPITIEALVSEFPNKELILEYLYR